MDVGSIPLHNSEMLEMLEKYDVQIEDNPKQTVWKYNTVNAKYHLKMPLDFCYLIITISWLLTLRIARKQLNSSYNRINWRVFGFYCWLLLILLLPRAHSSLESLEWNWKLDLDYDTFIVIQYKQLEMMEKKKFIRLWRIAWKFTFNSILYYAFVKWFERQVIRNTTSKKKIDHKCVWNYNMFSTLHNNITINMEKNKEKMRFYHSFTHQLELCCGFYLFIFLFIAANTLYSFGSFHCCYCRISVFILTKINRIACIRGYIALYIKWKNKKNSVFFASFLVFVSLLFIVCDNTRIYACIMILTFH